MSYRAMNLPKKQIFVIIFSFIILLPCAYGGDENNLKQIKELKEYEKIYALQVRYLQQDGLESKRFAPGYVDSKKFYQWKNVIIDWELVPNRGRRESPPILYYEEYKIEVVEIFPEIHYIIDSGKCVLGYFDRSSRIFYKWKGITITPEAIPKKFHNRIPKKFVKEEVFREIEIEAPDLFWENLFKNLNE